MESREKPYQQFFIGLLVTRHEALLDQWIMKVSGKCILFDLLTDVGDFMTVRRKPYAPEDERRRDKIHDGSPLKASETATSSEEPSETEELVNRRTLILHVIFMLQ